MKVDFIRAKAISKPKQILNENVSSTQLVSGSLPKYKISFCAKTSPERIEEERMKKNWWGRNVGWWFGGSSKAEVKVVQDMNNEANDLERQLFYGRGKLEEQEKTQGKIIKQQNDIIASKDVIIENQKKLEEASQQTIFYLNQTVEYQNKLITQTEEANRKLEVLYQEQKALVQEHEQQVQQLFNQMQNARIENDAKLQLALKTQMEEMQNVHKIEMEELVKSIDKASQAADTFKVIHDQTNKNKGFGRIAGYKEQKDILMDHFATPIALEKNGQAANVPGGILFFGPQGNGKTTFANAFAEQLDCELAPVRPEVDNPQKNWKKLNYEIGQAKKRFKQNRTRTIIVINEFEEFAPTNSKIIGSMKDLMDTLSKDYHCTIFATTNYPERIDKILLRDGRFYKAGLPPANKENATAVLKYYAEEFADKNVKYSELADEIVKTQPNSAFSNARIRSSVIQIVEKCQNIGKKLTQADLLESIKKLGHDIDIAALKTFENQLKYVAHI